MNKVLTLAVAVLVLSVGAAFAEPPVTTVAGDTSSVDSWGFEQLSDTDMAAVMGEGWRSGVCTVAVKAGGYLLFGINTITANPVGQAFGLGLVIMAGAICA